MKSILHFRLDSSSSLSFSVGLPPKNWNSEKLKTGIAAPKSHQIEPNLGSLESPWPGLSNGGRNFALASKLRAQRPFFENRKKSGGLLCYDVIAGFGRFWREIPNPSILKQSWWKSLEFDGEPIEVGQRPLRGLQAARAAIQDQSQWVWKEHEPFYGHEKIPMQLAGRWSASNLFSLLLICDTLCLGDSRNIISFEYM